MGEQALEVVLRRDRVVIAAALAALTALAWAHVLWLVDDMAMGGMDMTGFRMIPAGMGLMMFLVAFGLGSVVLDNPLVLTVVKWCGAAVLCWLAWKIATAGRPSPACIQGFNMPNRLVLGDNIVQPGERFEIAVFGINGPLSAGPANFLWFREAKVEFYR